MTVGGMGFIPERLLMMMMIIIIKGNQARTEKSPYMNTKINGLSTSPGGGGQK